MAAEIQRKLLKDGNWSGEVENLCKDGQSIWCRAVVSTLEHSAYGKIWVSVCNDITQARLAQKQLSERTQQAEAANVAKSQFLSMISHELRTPLHTMLGYIQLLKKESQGAIRRRLALINRTGVNLLKLINTLLEYNFGTDSAEELQTDALTLADFLGQLEHFGWLLSKNHNNQFLIKPTANLPKAVLVDELHLLQVLKNLIENACKFTHDGVVTLLVESVDSPRQ